MNAALLEVAPYYSYNNQVLDHRTRGQRWTVSRTNSGGSDYATWSHYSWRGCRLRNRSHSTGRDRRRALEMFS
jgi:hypothetical protein